MKKDESKDDDDNEDESSNNNADEYDPMEAEDADEYDDEGISCTLVTRLGYLIFYKQIGWTSVIIHR